MSRAISITLSEEQAAVIELALRQRIDLLELRRHRAEPVDRAPYTVQIEMARAALQKLVDA